MMENNNNPVSYEQNTINNTFQWNKKYWAVVGLLCALTNINIIGLIASLMGMKHSKNCHAELYALGISGVIISVVHIFCRIIMFLLLLVPWIEGTIDFQNFLRSLLIQLFS